MSCHALALHFSTSDFVVTALPRTSIVWLGPPFLSYSPASIQAGMYETSLHDKETGFCITDLVACLFQVDGQVAVLWMCVIPPDKLPGCENALAVLHISVECCL